MRRDTRLHRGGMLNASCVLRRVFLRFLTGDDDSPMLAESRAEYQSRRNRDAVFPSRYCLSRNRRTESKSDRALTIYASLARGTIYDAHFFSSGREITSYDVFTVIKFGKYSGS